MTATYTEDWDEGLEMDWERPCCEKHGPLASGIDANGKACFYCEDCEWEAAIRFPDQRHIQTMPSKQLITHYYNLITSRERGDMDIADAAFDVAIQQVEAELLMRVRV